MTKCSRWAMLGFAFCLLFTGGCKKRVYVENCTTPGNICVSGGVVISFSTTPDFDANQIVVTREVDPGLLDYQGGSATGTVTVTLANGNKVSYTGDLVYSSSKSSSFLSVTPGKQVYAFVPADPAALQAFINTYKNSTTSMDVDTTVALKDISDGTASSTIVDVQGEDRGSRDYIGSVGADLPRFEREGPYAY